MKHLFASLLFLLPLTAYGQSAQPTAWQPKNEHDRLATLLKTEPLDAKGVLSGKKYDDWYFGWKKAYGFEPGADYLIRIPKEMCVRNTRGNCGFCAVETCARYAGIDSLHGFAEGKGGSYPELMERWLNKYGLKRGEHFGQVYGRGSVEYLKQCIKNGWPCLFSIPGHALVCCGFSETTVWCIDNTGPNALQIKGWPINTWRQRHDGWVLCVWACPKNPRPPFKPRPAYPPDRPDCPT